MKTSFKKLLSVSVSLLLLVYSVMISADAAGKTKTAFPLSAGITVLRSQFESGKATQEDGFAIDYSYYSPVGKNDNGKYPVVIYLHGIGHGSHEGAQLADSTMAYWASSELQSRWNTGGAFIILPRCPEDRLQYWNTSLTNPLRRMIDDFIAEHRNNVDLSRIFIGGSSAGGEMTWNIITAYPDYFAGAFPMSATGTRTADDIKAAKDVAIWLFASKLDPIVNYLINVEPMWKKICEYNSSPADCRLSSFGMVCNPDGKVAMENHRVFQTISYDFFTVDNKPYPNVTTEDGLGNEITFNYPNGMISWMNDIHSNFNPDNVEVTFSINIANRILIPIRNLILKIGNIIQRILGFV